MEEQFIGNYKVLKKIGAGGMARVYLAVHKDVPNLKVVLKILSDPRLAERFRQEADKLALLDGHPNICRIKHFFNHGDDLVIAMEHIDGETLDEILKEKEKLPTDEALRIITHVLDILQTAHSKDIYHRDIKPSNIMIGKDSNVKIIDFGIARGKSDPRLTVAGTACGTPAYMAPEQFGSSEDLDYARVDIYAAGTTLYHLLTGEVPFKGDNQFVIRDAKLASGPPGPRKVNPEISKELESVILKSLQKDPDDRFQSAREMMDAITPLREGGGADVAVDRPPAVAAVRRRKKSKALPIFAGIIIVAAVAVFLIFQFMPSEEMPVVTGEADTSAVSSEEPDASVVGAGFPQGEIQLAVIPSGDIYFDGNLLGQNITDTSLAADTGRHVIRVENDRAVNKVITDTVYLAVDDSYLQRYEFEFTEEKPPESKPVTVTETGKVLIGSRPRGADVYIDGELQQQQTPYTFPLAVGIHIVRIELEVGGNLLSKVDTVRVSKDASVRVFFNTEE